MIRIPKAACILDIKLITSVEQFAELEEDWRMLSKDYPWSSVFTSWDWQWNWWQSYACGNLKRTSSDNLQLNIVVAREAGCIIAIFPLYIRKVITLGVIPVKELRLIGTGADTSPDYMGPLLVSDITKDRLRQICKYVVNLPGWDVMRFTDLSDNEELTSVLRDHLNQTKIKNELLPCALIRFIPLEGEWEDYLRSLSKNQRKQIRRRRRRFEESGVTNFYVWSSTEELDRIFDSMIQLHRKRWQNKRDGGSFSSREYLDFHKAVMRALLRQDELRLYCLEHEGTIVAMEYSYKWKNKIFSFQCGFDPKYSKYRPGQLQLAYSIEHAYSEGIKEYDMLKGEYEYKESAASGKRQTYFYTAYRYSAGGLGARMARCATKYGIWFKNLIIKKG